VEGPPATGKSDFAKALAEELEMQYFPMVTTDSWYINPYGFDLRTLDPIVPKSMRSYDEKRFIRVRC
jgi:NADH dehydrogenase (ubiquinone) 1 alpha subcomplex subunit 10